MLPQYNKATEPWRENYAVNASTELSLEAHSATVKERVDHQPAFLFTKLSMGAYKPVPVVITPVRFIGGPTRHVITGNIQGSWNP